MYSNDPLEPKDDRSPTPSSALPGGEPDRSLRIAIWEGCSSTLCGALTGGAIATAFALALGANDLHLGFLSAIGTLSAVGGIIGARATMRIGRRKIIVLRASLISRLALSLPALIPFLPLTQAQKIWLLIGITALSGLAIQLAVNPWLSWMTDLVPPERRGRYFAWRNTVLSSMGMLSAFGVGRAAVALQQIATERHLHPATAFVPLLAVSSFFALLSAWGYSRQWEPPLKREPVIPIREMLSLPFRHPPFRKFLRFTSLWAVALGVASPFFAPHMFRNLGMTVSGVATYSILAGLCALFAQPLWGRISDRIGHRPVLACNLLLVSLLPLIWLLATPS
ncbi:MAG: MFS transporter, partial [Kiritimatiellia bacterium]|nr:MFS transporter [Kiritimatiellia bacterium]